METLQQVNVLQFDRSTSGLWQISHPIIPLLSNFQIKFHDFLDLNKFKNFLYFRSDWKPLNILLKN